MKKKKIITSKIIYMSRGYQYNYSAIADDLYNLNFRQNKAKKTISILVDYLSDTNHLSLLDIGCSTGIMIWNMESNSNKFLELILIQMQFKNTLTKITT